MRAPLSLVANRAFNVGSNEQNLTLLDVGKLINEIVPTAKIIETNENVDRRNYRVNFDRIRSVLGFLPSWTIEKGVRQIVDAVGSGEIGSYTASNYSNVRVLREAGSSTFVRRYNTGWEPAYLDIRAPVNGEGELSRKVAQG